MSEREHDGPMIATADRSEGYQYSPEVQRRRWDSVGRSNPDWGAVLVLAEEVEAARIAAWIRKNYPEVA